MLRAKMKLPVFETLHQTHVLLEICKGVLTGANDHRWIRHILGSNGRPTSTTDSKETKKTLSEDLMVETTSTAKRTRPSITNTGNLSKDEEPMAKKAKQSKSTPSKVSRSIASEAAGSADEIRNRADNTPDIIDVVGADSIVSAPGTLRLRAKRGDADVQVR